MSGKQKKFGEPFPTKAEEWPAWLASLREHFGYTQTEAAARLRLTQSLWSKWENGRMVPDDSRQILLWQLANGRLAIPEEE